MVRESDERLKAARAAIARACLDALPSDQLGDICLRPEQRRICARAQRALDEHGGCLVGEDVGRGKTFIALALAQRWSTPLIVAPASLRSTWQSALARVGVDYPIVSHESLSRGHAAHVLFDALIVDEAHHFRNPATLRYAELARMAAAVPIVLLSATPLQNRDRDLAAQVALFHGEGAFFLIRESLARFIIRGDDAPQPDMPAVAPPEWLGVDADDGAVLAAILDLPPPARPSDGGDAGALRTIGFVRAWASSRAALQATLRSRRRVATAIAQGLEAGLTPTRREARAWQSAEGVVQLGFASVLIQRSAEAPSLAALRDELDADDVAMGRLRLALADSTNPDVARVTALRGLRFVYPQARIVAFSEYSSTVVAYFDALRHDAGVGMLTARGARIATGRIARDDLLARFAPLAQGALPSAPHQAVTLLLTTDILAEGVNLQDASVVLHLDLPWNPARLAQRVGRVRRPGGAKIVRSYLLAPPAHADLLLTLDARLRRKLDHARHVVGAAFHVLPSFGSAPATIARVADSIGSSATAAGALVDELQRWLAEDCRSRICSTATLRRDGTTSSGHDTGSSAVKQGGERGSKPHSTSITSDARGPMAVGAAVYHERGWLAALDDGRMVGCLRDVPSESVAHVSLLATAAEGIPRPANEGEVATALGTLDRWLRQRELLDTCGVTHAVGPLRRAVDAHLATILRQARRHEHAPVLRLVSRLRQQVARPMPLGAERAIVHQLQTVVAQPECAVGMLTTALDDLYAGAHSRVRDSRSKLADRVMALIVVGPSIGDDAQA
ncbi:MAG: DEAD/DEAH box helicase [Gemmatimonadota bacterium]|nr:DEAD/DEAH box helicase [Gemmatimonadota bacterium]